MQWLNLRRDVREPIPSPAEAQRRLAQVGDAEVGGTKIVGTAEDVRARLDALVRASVADELMVVTTAFDVATRIDTLAAILASSSSLQEFSDSFDAATRRDLATTIREEAERLDHFVANLLHMTRLEAGALTLRKTPFNVPEVIRRALSRGLENGAWSWQAR